MTAVDILILWKMMICLIFGAEAAICDGLHCKRMVLTILIVSSQYLLLPTTQSLLRQWWFKLLGKTFFYSFKYLFHQMQWSSQWVISEPADWCLLDKRLETVSSESTLTSKISAGSSQRFSVQKSNFLGDHFQYHHIPYTFHYMVLYPALYNRHRPAGNVK